MKMRAFWLLLGLGACAPQQPRPVSQVQSTPVVVPVLEQTVPPKQKSLDQKLAQTSTELLRLVNRPDISPGTRDMLTRLHHQMIEARKRGDLKRAENLATVLEEVSRK